jgi:pSer/pThr/pTyr-binding forkhead associated (FHA) protein
MFPTSRADMKDAPAIAVQIIHIEGPLKGSIQEFGESEILIGRHPSCQLVFPKDLTIVSRKHAKIVREGNRFKLTDLSANGTFVNGKRIQETFLKEGDVMMFAEGGPKVSFLTALSTSRDEIPRAPHFSPPPEPFPRVSPLPSDPPKVGPKSAADPVQGFGEVSVPLVIQIGPTLHSFKKLPVTVGKNPNCELILNHPSILDQHAVFFFAQDQYWVKDLTGRNLISVNGEPVLREAPIGPESRLSFSAQGPTFRFLGGGRFAEMEDELPAGKQEAGSSSNQPTGKRRDGEDDSGKTPSRFRRFFKS